MRHPLLSAHACLCPTSYIIMPRLPDTSRWSFSEPDLIFSFLRIVRNKAAEKVKEIGGYDSPSPGPLTPSLETHPGLRWAESTSVI